MKAAIDPMNAKPLVLALFARHWNPDGTLTPWRRVKRLDLQQLPEFSTIESLEAAWVTELPPDNRPNAILRLSPQLRIQDFPSSGNSQPLPGVQSPSIPTR